MWYARQISGLSIQRCDFIFMNFVANIKFMRVEYNALTYRENYSSTLIKLANLCFVDSCYFCWFDVGIVIGLVLRTFEYSKKLGISSVHFMYSPIRLIRWHVSTRTREKLDFQMIIRSVPVLNWSPRIGKHVIHDEACMKRRLHNLRKKNLLGKRSYEILKLYCSDNVFGLISSTSV